MTLTFQLQLDEATPVRCKSILSGGLKTPQKRSEPIYKSVEALEISNSEYEDFIQLGALRFLTEEMGGIDGFYFKNFHLEAANAFTMRSHIACSDRLAANQKAERSLVKERGGGCTHTQKQISQHIYFRMISGGTSG